MVFQPMSTGITYQLIPKATADGVTVYSTGYGRTSAANGKVFKWIFNAPVTYWDGASIAVRHILKQNLGNIKGKKIALVYHNSAYGKETIRTLETLAKNGQLAAYEHFGFWQPMDTLREKNLLEHLWNYGEAPWKIWE